jgi:hypothetical protein
LEKRFAVLPLFGNAHLVQERHEARLGADGIEDGIPTYPRHHLRIGREGPLEVVERAGAVAKTDVHKRQVEKAA